MSLFAEKPTRQEPVQEKRKGLHLPKLAFGKLAVAAAGLGLIASYGLTGTYRIQEGEAAYAMSLLSYGQTVRVDMDQGLHWWPSNAAAPPWPFGSTAVIPLAGEYEKVTVSTPLYSTEWAAIGFSARPGAEEAFTLRYGPYAKSTDILQELLNRGDRSVLDVVRENGRDVSGVEQVVLSEIQNAMATVLRGKSVEEVNRLKDDPVFMAYLESEVENAMPLIDITSLDLEIVRRQPGVITVHTADGFDLDVLLNVRAGTGSSGLVNAAVVQEVFGEHYLMEFRSGQLPSSVNEELTSRLGLQNVIAPNYMDPDSRALGTQRLLKVDVSGARDQFYRTFFNSGVLVTQIRFADDLASVGDLEQAVAMYQGILEFEKVAPLSEGATGVVADAKFALGIIYEDLATAYMLNGDQDGARVYLRQGIFYYLDFMRTAPADHPQRLIVSRHLTETYGGALNYDRVEINDEAFDKNFDQFFDGLMPPADVPEEAESTPAAQPTESVTPTPTP